MSKDEKIDKAISSIDSHLGSLYRKIDELEEKIRFLIRELEEEVATKEGEDFTFPFYRRKK